MKNVEKDRSFAPEQYELHEPPRYTFTMDRRTFFNMLGGGIAVAWVTASSVAEAMSPASSVDDGDQISAWLHISESGKVTVYTGKVEVGQNIRTSLAQVVAEELGVAMEDISMVMGDTALTPYDRGTFGSLSTPVMGPQLRRAAASAREWLIDMAAAEWKTDRASLYVEKGFVKNSQGKQSLPVGQLTKGKELVKVIQDKQPLKPVDQWKIAGTSINKVNGDTFVTGKHKYVSDMKLPGMLYGKILRPPAYGATLSFIDIAAARQMKGVTVVQDGDFVGVTAPDMRTASEAIKAIRAEWEETPQPSRNEIFDHLVKNADPKETRVSGSSGDAKGAFDKAAVRLEQTFFVDYIAHAPLEPRAGLAQWEGNKLTVWTGTQRPFGVQEELHKIFHIPKENIRVIMPDTGSGYGGKHTGEAGIEAARLAREVQKPVRVFWSREEEFTWAYFRPAGVIKVKAGADKDGMVTSWEFHNYNSGTAGIETPYTVSNKQIEFHPSDSPLRQGSYRGLAGTANVFARESVMNDLALELREDPLAFRLKNLAEERMKNVLQAAADKFSWSTRKPVQDHGYGIACGEEKGGYVATCAEVMLDRSSGEIKVVRAVVVFECGAIINPDHLENQIQGAVVQGLGGALFERVDFRQGKVLNPSFSRYRVPRFSDMPVIEAVMLNRKDLASAGAGETPIMAIAPAIRNAIMDATGKKLFSLPLVPDGFEV